MNLRVVCKQNVSGNDKTDQILELLKHTDTHGDGGIDHITDILKAGALDDGDIDAHSFHYLGEGECRDSNNEYAVEFHKGYWDLRPHTSGTNAQTAESRCSDACSRYDWCAGYYVITRDIWPTPECSLVTNRAKFAATGIALPTTWGSGTTIDGVSYQTYIGGG